MTRSLVILVLLAGFGQARPLRADPAVITLQAATATEEPIVLLQDVATIKGGSSELRTQLEQIDLWEFKEADEKEAAITRGLVRTRLLLAGFSADSFQLQGEDETLVRHGLNMQAAAVRTSRNGPRTGANLRSSAMKPLTDADLELLLQEGIAESLRLDPQDVRVRLGQACLSRVLPKELLGKAGLLEPTLPARALPGRLNVSVRVEVDQKVMNVMTQIDLAIRRPVLVVTADLARGTKLADADLEERPVWLTRAEPHPRRSDAIDSTLSRDLFEGQPLKMNDLVRRPSSGSNDAAIVIKSRDKVQATARKGGMVIVVKDAEAQRQGRVGEWIEVRNLTTGRTFTARVLGPGEVEVPL